MRIVVLLSVISITSACSALMVSGGASGSTRSGASAAEMSDSAVTVAVRNNIVADASISSFIIGVRTNAGKVTLTGTVDSYVAFDQAERIAIRTAGVKAIENRIVVEVIQ